MPKKHLVKIIRIDASIEELIVLNIQDIIFRCFVDYCPLVIKEGETYEAEFEMVLPDELNITKAEHGESRIEMLDDGFSCDVYGYLEGDLVLSFINFSDQGVHYDYPYLNGQFVKITAERINVSF